MFTAIAAAAALPVVLGLQLGAPVLAGGTHDEAGKH
jgi:hypothetical protein